MAHPRLRRGERGDEVRRLQGVLNRVGAMLVTDGDFGGGTERAVRYAQEVAGLPVTGQADAALWSWLEAQPEPFVALGTEGVSFIAREETGGLAYYEAHASWPHYPGHESGITLGVGYDLRFHDAADFQQAWGGLLSPAALRELSRDLGQRGSKERAQALKALGIRVPFHNAWGIFLVHILPPAYDETQRVYPSLESLSPLCRSALVSLVYNRGGSLRGPARAEMRAIRDILAEAAAPSLAPARRSAILAGVEDQLLAMQRLWGSESGLFKRRQGEANLWRRGLAEA